MFSFHVSCIITFYCFLSSYTSLTSLACAIPSTTIIIINNQQQQHKNNFSHFKREAKIFFVIKKLFTHLLLISRLIYSIVDVECDADADDDVMTAYSDVKSGSFSTRIVWITMSIWIALNNSIRCVPASLCTIFFIFFYSFSFLTMSSISSRLRRFKFDGRRSVWSKFRKLR